MDLLINYIPTSLAQIAIAYAEVREEECLGTLTKVSGNNPYYLTLTGGILQMMSECSCKYQLVGEDFSSDKTFEDLLGENAIFTNMPYGISVSALGKTYLIICESSKCSIRRSSIFFGFQKVAST